MDSKNNMDYKTEPGKKFKIRYLFLALIILILLVTGIFMVINKLFNQTDVQTFCSSISSKFSSAISNIRNSQHSNKDKKSSPQDADSSNEDTNNNNDDKITSANSGYADKRNSGSSSSSETDYSRLSIEDYARICTDKTFGSKDTGSNSYFSKVLYMHNNYTVYINIGTYRNREELHLGALNASIELYKALYTLCPEKFGSTLFGVYVSGSYIDDNGNSKGPDEVMFSWFDEKCLNSADINSLNSDNFQDMIYRYYDPYKHVNIQKD